MQAFLGSLWNLPEPQIQQTSWGWDVGGVWGQAWSAVFSLPHAPLGTHVSGSDGSSKWPGWGGVPFTFLPSFLLAVRKQPALWRVGCRAG